MFSVWSDPILGQVENQSHTGTSGLPNTSFDKKNGKSEKLKIEQKKFRAVVLLIKTCRGCATCISATVVYDGLVVVIVSSKYIFPHKFNTLNTASRVETIISAIKIIVSNRAMEVLSEYIVHPTTGRPGVT